MNPAQSGPVQRSAHPLLRAQQLERLQPHPIRMQIPAKHLISRPKLAPRRSVRFRCVEGCPVLPAATRGHPRDSPLPASRPLRARRRPPPRKRLRLLPTPTLLRLPRRPQRPQVWEPRPAPPQPHPTSQRRRRLRPRHRQRLSPSTRRQSRPHNPQRLETSHCGAVCPASPAAILGLRRALPPPVRKPPPGHWRRQPLQHHGPPRIRVCLPMPRLRQPAMHPPLPKRHRRPPRRPWQLPGRLRSRPVLPPP